jgi:hypothetical protein
MGALLVKKHPQSPSRQGLGRRLFLCGGAAALLLTRSHASHADLYPSFRVWAPHLESRFRNWWARAEGFANELVTSDVPSVVRF